MDEIQRVKKYNTVKLFEDPLDIKDNDNVVDVSEMTRFQLSFICGLIKETQPHKILEVGCAAGGTTQIVLKCCDMLKINGEMISFDLNDLLYSDNSKKTGYLVDTSILEKGLFNHKLITGGGVRVLPEYLESIGGVIDFLILDTVHLLPGEILDFLATLPYLKDGAIVVVHDISLNHIVSNTNAFATRLLFSAVHGEKYLMDESELPFDFSNIGAFKVDRETKVHLFDLFSCLSATWTFMPEDSQLEIYKSWFKKKYGDYIGDYFNRICCIQRDSSVVRNVREAFGSQRLGIWKQNKCVLFGAGYWGRQIYSYARRFKIQIDAIVVSDVDTITEVDKEYFDVPIISLSDIPSDYRNDMFIVGVSVEKYNEIVDILKSWGIEKIG